VHNIFDLLTCVIIPRKNKAGLYKNQNKMVKQKWLTEKNRKTWG